MNVYKERTSVCDFLVFLEFEQTYGVLILYGKRFWRVWLGVVGLWSCGWFWGVFGCL